VGVALRVALWLVELVGSAAAWAIIEEWFDEWFSEEPPAIPAGPPIAPPLPPAPSPAGGGLPVLEFSSLQQTRQVLEPPSPTPGDEANEADDAVGLPPVIVVEPAAELRQLPTDPETIGEVARALTVLRLRTPNTRSAAVLLLQRLLAVVDGATLEPDSIFGRQTDDAVRSYQRGEDLTSDGIVGPLTWAALLTDWATVRAGTQAVA